MRVALVGPAADCGRIRADLNGSAEVVAEFPSLEAARTAAPDVDAYVVSNAPSGVVPGLAEQLTPRELQVLNLLAEGLPNKAIAARLGISDQTVKFHVAAISGKLGASNRTAAVRLAFRRGLVTL